MGQGVRLTMGEALTSSSIGQASLGGPSLDPSLIVIGSASTPDRGGLGAPSSSWRWALQPALATAGWTPPPMGEAERPRYWSTAEDWRSLQATDSKN